LYFFYYFPVGLDAGHRRTPLITRFLVLMCVVMFIAYRYGPANHIWNPANLMFLPTRPLLPTALTHVFLHNGWVHLVGNMVYLLIFGRALEDRLGPGKFFAVFAASAVGGAWIHTALVGLFAPEYAVYGVIGASGATSGLLGAFMVRLYFTRIRVAYWVFMPLQGVNRAGRKLVPAFIAVLCWFVYQGVYATMQLGSGGAGVAYSVHTGGFVAGILVAVLVGSVPAARAEKRLARARRKMEKADFFGAQADLLEYLEMRPSDADVHCETARAFLAGGRAGEAGSHLREAVRLFMERGMRGEAEDAAVFAMRAVPGFTLSETDHLDLAFGMERSMKFSGAVEAYENFRARYPRSPEIPFVLLRIAVLRERRFGQLRAALECYEEVAGGIPGDGWSDFACSEAERLRRACPAVPEAR